MSSFFFVFIPCSCEFKMLTTRLLYCRRLHSHYALVRYAHTQYLKSRTTTTTQYYTTNFTVIQSQRRRTFVTSFTPKPRTSRFVQLSLLVTGVSIGYVAGNAYLNPKGVVGPWQVSYNYDYRSIFT
jgi:hypothetical protein